MPGITAHQRISGAALGRREGREHGYQLGMNYGYYYGRCEAVMRQSPIRSQGWWDARILYITSGKGFPYSPLDASIIEALRELVRELIVLTPVQDIVAAAEQIKPDYVIVLDGLNVEVDRIDLIRSLGVRTAVWLTDDPYYTDMTLPMTLHYDAVFTLELECVELYRSNGSAQVHYLPFAANPSIFRPKPIPLHYRYDVGFIGSAYWNRAHFFDQIAPFLAKRHTYISGLWWDRLKSYRLLSDKIELNKWMEAEETATYYNGMKISINLHRSVDDESFNNNSRLIGAVSPNPRTFEIAGCGTLQLTDMRGDLPRFYTPDQEIVTYSSTEELKEKIDFYLAHEEARRAIALGALRRTMSEHTYSHRMAQMMRLLLG
ncbi:spore maturation protein CgeB [Paenibacillus sp. UNCCL117]|uniref:glycosyltransferase family protein n=1 Tax=unclassified Paenibacillus TaxID=185978 RepID=UPI00088C0AAA|nr:MULTISPECIES: glycosyltransferase [unclassified Paenibacillus]SDD30401.1 spore maturation protein CgeB [Paenibacillus sp. cl123]SFW40349.1 spore maturation protein CgeB [Paenibacillus sp. UNCCL117]